MGKFDKYLNRKMKIAVDGQEFDIDFRVRDRIDLAAIHECRKQDDQYDRLITFCNTLLKRSYPNEPEGAFDGFLSVNLEKFLEEVMVGANLAKREQFAKQGSGDFRKEGDTGAVQAEASAKP